MSDQLQLRKHVRFLVRHLNVFPSAYASLDSNRLTLLFFALSGLDILNEFDSIVSEDKKKQYIDWIYTLQLGPESGCAPDQCGFRGSLGCAPPPKKEEEGDTFHGSSSGYDSANIAQTYSALLCLLILGDDLSRVNKDAILRAIKLSQRENGCFWSQGEGSESDMRFVFCAVSICHILGSPYVIDWIRLAKFIRLSRSYDGGIGQGPGEESHGGSTYCAIASLSLAGHLWDGSVFDEKDIQRLIKWALHKQSKGFHGRAGKPDDTCYAFWIGATLEILNSHYLCGNAEVRSFLLTAQHNHMGGYAKLPEEGAYPDILHTYFSIAALSLLHEPGLLPINASLNLSRRAYERIGKINFTE